MPTLDDIRLKTKDRHAIAKAVRVLRQHPLVEHVLLYGSKARGDDRAGSDVDLLVLTSRDITWSEEQEIAELLYPLQLDHGVLFSPLIVSAREWREGVYQVLPIRAEVERDGVRL